MNLIDIALARKYTDSKIDNLTSTAVEQASDAIIAAGETAAQEISQAIDQTLTTAGKAADAKKTGDEITDLKSHLNALYVTDTATGAIASFPDGADNIPVKDLTITIEPVQSGSGDPSPTNIRPITGWTGGDVVRCGVNQWDEETELGYYDASNGNKTTFNGELRSVNLVPILPNTTYYGSGFKTNCSCVYFDANKNYLGWASPNGLFTTPSKAYYMGLNLGNQYGTTYNNDVSVNYPSTDTTYHAYSGTVIPISWQTEAGTVYGGTVDVTSGVLTVDKVSAVLDGISQGLKFEGTPEDYGNNTRFHVNYSSALPTGKYAGIDSYCKCDTLKPSYSEVIGVSSSSPAYHSIWSHINCIFVCLPRSEYTTNEQANAFLQSNNVQVVYKLATPQTYQLTATELKTLLGQNNIWATTGNTTVEYRADTKLYIQKMLS